MPGEAATILRDVGRCGGCFGSMRPAGRTFAWAATAYSRQDATEKLKPAFLSLNVAVAMMHPWQSRAAECLQIRGSAMTTRLDRISLLAAAALLGLAVGAAPALAAGTDTPAPAPSPTDQKGSDTKAPDTKGEDKKAIDEKQSQREFLDGYRYAYNLIQKGEYEGGIAALRALKQDSHPDVANYIGYANRKLGRYADAKFWYEQALASDPKHVRTWSYYGMWHAEQGNRLKAEDYLQTIRLICGGTGCDEFKALKDVLDGTVTY
jgi:tetratricopeptide (TPR) repeat protein